MGFNERYFAILHMYPHGTGTVTIAWAGCGKNFHPGLIRVLKVLIPGKIYKNKLFFCDGG
jgi:hypothetical protein